MANCLLNNYGFYALNSQLSVGGLSALQIIPGVRGL